MNKLILSLIALLFSVSLAFALEPIELRCEYRDDPLGIDTTTPRLSWKVKSLDRSQTQSAYRSLVASSPQVLAKDQGDLWDSGEIARAPKSLVTSKPKDTSINPDGIDLSQATKIASWDFSNKDDVAKWGDRKSVAVKTESGKTYLVATGDDSQMAAKLGSAVRGNLVVELVGMTVKGCNSQFFWAGPDRGFNGIEQTKRLLQPSEQVNHYLFSVRSDKAIGKLWFDPFASYDKYAKVGKMLIQSISVYQIRK